jgi:L-seryl-tRNA(Ser) seleniumtransferase
MSTRTQPGNASALSALPSIDDLLRSESGSKLLDIAGRHRLTQLARRVVDDLRHELKNEEVTSSKTKSDVLSEAESRLTSVWHESQSMGLRRVINATGVVIHTNLGRAPLSGSAKAALVESSGYCTVEYDIVTGERGKRGERVEAMICELTGAEGALVINNCAAAAYLVLSVFAVGSEVIISRGELVEIGGEFRVPDVLSRSGATLKEVGTTNRTKIADYEKAITDKTSMILKVHPSNYRIVGFTTSPSLSELSELSKRNNILLYEDAGSGVVADLGSYGLADEPVIGKSINAGADIVTFSGDKLLGGPQSGIIIGKSEFIERLRKDPLYRALRVSKLIYAALEATLESHLRGNAVDEIPVLRMLAVAADELEDRCRELIQGLDNSNLTSEIIHGNSAVGGGAAPMFQPESALIVLKHSRLSAYELEIKLRMSKVPVIARIVDDRVTIDLRTVSESEMKDLASALQEV